MEEWSYSSTIVHPVVCIKPRPLYPRGNRRSYGKAGDCVGDRAGLNGVNRKIFTPAGNRCPVTGIALPFLLFLDTSVTIVDCYRLDGDVSGFDSRQGSFLHSTHKINRKKKGTRYAECIYVMCTPFVPNMFRSHKYCDMTAESRKSEVRIDVQY
jgi:hypothetical protein